MKFLITCTFLLLSISIFAQTSNDNQRLRQALEKYPDADANKDGVLTMKEALAYQKKRRNKKKISAEDIDLSKMPVSGDIKKGYSGLYMGHSFFVPGVRELGAIIPETTLSNHHQYQVYRGGAGGSPGSLWQIDSARKAGQKYLSSKKINLLVMTYYSEENSSVTDYSRWFDYAISQNPKITFMVTIPWDKFLYKKDAAELKKSREMHKKIYTSVILKLRQKYPNNAVLYCPYGLGTYELIDRLKEGKLAGVKHILNPDKSTRSRVGNPDELLRDELGHPGMLVSKLSALIWLQTLYNYDLNQLDPQKVRGLPKIDLREIATKVQEKIRPYNTEPK